MRVKEHSFDKPSHDEKGWAILALHFPAMRKILLCLPGNTKREDIKQHDNDLQIKMLITITVVYLFFNSHYFVESRFKIWHSSYIQSFAMYFLCNKIDNVDF